MLYIKKINLTREAFESVIENMKQTVSNDYYADNELLSHLLPLPVLNLLLDGEIYVKSGYTVNEYSFIYTSCAGNMAGVFEAWNDNFYFFMAGRRHGVVKALDYLPSELVPVDYVNPLVYLSNNVDVEPTSTDVGYGNSRIGRVWNRTIDVDVSYIFKEGVSTKLNKDTATLIKAGAALYDGQLPDDIVDIEIEAITIEVGETVHWSPTVTVDGIRFKAESIESDRDSLTLRGGDYIVNVIPSGAGYKYTHVELTKAPKQ